VNQAGVTSFQGAGQVMDLHSQMVEPQVAPAPPQQSAQVAQLPSQVPQPAQSPIQQPALQVEQQMMQEITKNIC
jgi:hypothetical protein